MNTSHWRMQAGAKSNSHRNQYKDFLKCERSLKAQQMILLITTKKGPPFGRAPKHSSVAQWQSIRLLTGGL
jgi:hypothetical protein